MAGWRRQAEEEAAATARPWDLRGLVGLVPNFGRRLRVASPCVGINGCGVCLEALGIPSSYNNCWDLEEGYASWLSKFSIEGELCITDC